MRKTPVAYEIFPLIVTLFIAAAVPTLALGQGALSDDMQACAAINNNADRLNCYDGLVNAETSEPNATPQLSDKIGKERVKTSEPRPKEEYAATVTRCEESRSAAGRYFFYLENGQVWKQTDNRRRQWKDCRFGVSISKDGFGYKMHVPDKDRTVRVTRVR